MNCILTDHIVQGNILWSYDRAIRTTHRYCYWSVMGPYVIKELELKLGYIIVELSFIPIIWGIRSIFISVS